MDIVIQGPEYPQTEEIIKNFMRCDFVDKIFFSTWADSKHSAGKEEGWFCTNIYSDDVINPGVGNRNRQIVSTQAGLREVTSDIVAKFRSDQVFPIETLEFMNEFYNEHTDNFKIFVLGLYKNWPFHPRDHMFWGPTERINQLFDVPLDPTTIEFDGNYDAALRAETWLGAHYAAKHSINTKLMIRYPTLYLTDSAPMKETAFLTHNEWFHTLFCPFPRIKYSWPNKGLDEYYYDMTSEVWSEYWWEEYEKVHSKFRM